jgi:hypothetical protein
MVKRIYYYVKLRSSLLTFSWLFIHRSTVSFKAKPSERRCFDLSKSKLIQVKENEQNCLAICLHVKASLTRKVRGKTIVNKQGVSLRAGGIFDLTYFDNSN